MTAVDSIHEATVGPSDLRDAVGRLVEGGGTVDGLFAVRRGRQAEVRYVASAPGGDLIIRCAAPGGRVPTIVDMVPGVAWDEREARDLHGVVFAGHEPHRPFVEHPEAVGDWTTPIHGEGVHQVAVGPIHAGVIESGHFRFHCVGDQILHVDVRLFYKHRGLELSAEGRDAERAIPVVQRACAACAAANTVAFAQAVEQAAGLRPDVRMRRARTLAVELERLYNHLNDIGAVCAGVGLAPGAMAFAALKEEAQRIVQALAGHRFLFGSVTIGRSRLSIGATAAAAARRELRDLERDVAAAWRSLRSDASLADRVRGVGVLTGDDALRLGVVGPAGRASGRRRDARASSSRLWYPDFEPMVPADPAGDVRARLEMRALELPPAFAILDDLLSGELAPGEATESHAPARHGVGRVESPRGETICAVELAGESIARVHLRTGSYANWPALARAAAGALLPDFPLINKSFELCYACVDR